MRRHTVWPFVAIFLLTAALTAALIGTLNERKLTAPTQSLDRRVMADGTVIELLNMDDDRMALRRIAPSGLIDSFIRLPAASGRDMFSTYNMVGIIDTSLYLHHYESPGNTPERYVESIIAYDVDSGERRVVAQAPPSGNNDVLRAIDIAGEAVLLGYVNRENEELTVWRIDAASGTVSVGYEVTAPFPVASIAVTKHGGLYALACDSIVYRLIDGGWEKIFRAEWNEVVANMMPGADNLLYLFLSSSKGTRSVVSTPNGDGFLPFDIDTDDFIKLHVATASNWVAVSKDYEYIVSADGERKTVAKLSAPFSLLWDSESLLYLAGTMIISVALLPLIRYVYLKRKLRLLVKLLMALLPVLTIGMFLLVSAATSFVVETTEKDIRESLLEYANDHVKSIDGERFARINWHDPYNDQYYTSLLEYTQNLSQYRSMAMSGGIEHIAYTSCWLYRVDGGKVYTAVCDYFVVGLEMAHFEAFARVAVRDEMLSSRLPAYDYIYGIESETRWLAVLHPILDGDKVVGYLEVARPIVAINAAVRDVSEKIMLSGILVFVVVIAVLFLVLSISTHTLGRLKRGALAVSGGDYAARVVSHSWDEAGDIAVAFNNMAESVESSIKDITAVSQGYSRFVSDELIDLLNKDSIKEVNPGDHITMTATQILVFTDSFDAIEDKALFDALGRFYGAVIPAIAAGGGLISGNSAHGFNAMFSCAPDGALHAVLNVYAALDLLGDKVECHIFLYYSGAVLGVTGNSEHLNIITISRLSYEAYAVGDAGKRFGVRLIVSQSAYAVMGDAAANYRRRFLGFLRADGKLHMLYDFFDCDTPEIRHKKDVTKESFEFGVRLYYAKDYAEARRIFVDIIKAFPEDLTSREYLRRSNTGQEYGGEPMPLIELY